MVYTATVVSGNPDIRYTYPHTAAVQISLHDTPRQAVPGGLLSNALEAKWQVALARTQT